MIFAFFNNEEFLNIILNRLAEFVKTNDGPHFIYLCPQVDELLISVAYDIQRRFAFYDKIDTETKVSNS